MLVTWWTYDVRERTLGQRVQFGCTLCYYSECELFLVYDPWARDFSADEPVLYRRARGPSSDGVHGGVFVCCGRSAARRQCCASPSGFAGRLGR